MTETEFSMWDAPAEQITASRTLHATSLAKAAVEPLWPYLSAAKTKVEFDQRLALSGDALLRMIGEVIEDPSLPADQMRLVATESLKDRFAAHQQDREAARAQKEAQQAAQRVQDAVADSLRAATAGSSTHTASYEATRKHAEAEGSRRTAAGDVAQVMAYPQCDICKVNEAHYDGATEFGPWAYMCDRCFSAHGLGLGTGRGQRLEIAPGSKNAKHEAADASEEVTCPECHGAGEVAINAERDENGVWDADWEKCPTCGGSGSLPHWVRDAARRTAAVRCTYDSGSMYGNTGQCPNRAQWVVTYQNGTLGPFNAPVCEAHLGAMEGRVYPGLIEVVPVGATSSRRIAEWDMRTPEQGEYDSGYLNGKRDRESGNDPQGVGFTFDPQTDYERGYWAGYGLKESSRRIAGWPGAEKSEALTLKSGDYAKYKGEVVQVDEAIEDENRYAIRFLDGNDTVTVGREDLLKTDKDGTAIHGSLHTAPGGGPHAPYNVERRGDKWVVVNDLGEVKGTHDSKEEAREQQKALYANVPGASEQAEKKAAAYEPTGETFTSPCDTCGQPVAFEWMKNEGGFRSSEPVAPGSGSDHLSTWCAQHAPRRQSSATRKTADALQQAIRAGMMIGVPEFTHPDAMLPDFAWVVTEPGPNGARLTSRKTTDRAEANRWAEELLARTDWSPYTKSSAKVALIDWQGDTHFGVGYLTGVAPNGDIYEVYSNPNSNPTPASWVNYGPEGDTGPNSGIAEGRGFATMEEAMADAEAHAAGRTASITGARHAAWTHENARHAFDHGWDVGTREASGQQVSDDEHGSTNYASAWSEGYREGMHYANEDVLDTRHSESDWVAASRRTALNGWTRDLGHDDDSAVAFAMDNLGLRLRITFEDGDMEWGHFERGSGGAPEWKGERNDYTFPIDFGAVSDMTRVSEPAPVGQGELFSKAPYDLTASRRAVEALLVEADADVTCADCGKTFPRSEAYLRSNVGGDAPLAYCPQCAAKKGWAPKHRYERAASRSAVADLLETEGAFFHHQQPAQSGTHAPDGRKAPAWPADRLQQMRDRDRTEADSERDFERRSEEYWDSHPEERERHVQQNASRRQAGTNPKMEDPDYAAGFKAGVDDADKARGFSLQNYPQSSNSSFAEGYYAGYDGWNNSDAYYFGTESSRRQAVNEDAYGSERYQRLEAPGRPAWITDAWDDKGTEAYTEQGRAAYVPDNPFAKTLTTIRQSAMKHLSAEHSEVPQQQPGANIDGLEQNSDFDDASRSPRTTRPRVMPTRTPDITNPPNFGEEGMGGSFDAAPGNSFDMGYDPMQPTADQLVTARIARLAAKVQADNPTMPPDQAKALAAQTVAAYPEMVSVQR